MEPPTSSSGQDGFAPSTVDTRTGSAKQTQQGSKGRQERRSQKRARIKLAARIGPADFVPGKCAEIIATVNASRQSLYFITDNDTYRLGMRVRVTFPYDAAHDDLTASEDYGEIMRTERLPDNRVGVAVRLKKPAQAQRSAITSNRAAEERRAADRHPFSAEAIVIDLYGSMRVQARCSDLSLQGCYLDTLNPFPSGALVRVELRTSDKVLEAIALVNSSHVGMGMGLQFQDLTPVQTSVLAHWLSSEPTGRMWLASPASNPKQPESSDRIVAINLIRDILAKGILTKADISDIFFNTAII
jgi:hypothetical protein